MTALAAIRRVRRPLGSVDPGAAAGTAPPRCPLVRGVPRAIGGKARGEKVDERAHLGRQMALVGIEGVDQAALGPRASPQPGRRGPPPDRRQRGQGQHRPPALSRVRRPLGSVDPGAAAGTPVPPRPGAHAGNCLAIVKLAAIRFRLCSQELEARCPDARLWVISGHAKEALESGFKPTGDIPLIPPAGFSQALDQVLRKKPAGC